MTLGGRAAEEIVFCEITTGASNDLEKVTETAKQMVMRFGMSERLGPRVFGHDRGHAVPRPRVLRRARLLRRGRARDRRRDPPHRRGSPPDRARHPHRQARELDTISRILLERETIEAEQFVALLEGKPEEEVFPPDEEDAAPDVPEAEAEKGSAREGARPRVQPKPGLAGGGAAEMRGDPDR